MWPFNRKRKELNSAELRKRFQEQGEWSQNLVANFSAYIEDTGLGFNVRDISKLPWPKEDLIRAFTFLLAVHPEGDMREAIKVTLMSLAQFHRDVGQVDLSPMPRLSKPIDQLSSDELSAAMTAHTPIHQAYQLFQQKVEGELLGLKAVWDQPPLVQ